MAAFSTIGAIAGATALGGFLFGRKSKKAPAAPAPAPAQAQAATPAAPPPPPNAAVQESTALAGAREAAQRVRKRIPGGGFAGGLKSRPSPSQMGAGAGYAPRTLIGA